MKRLLFVWCASQLITCGAMQLTPDQTTLDKHDERINRYEQNAILDWADNLDGVARLFAAEEERALMGSIEQQADSLTAKTDKFIRNSHYAAYATIVTILTTGGIGSTKLIRSWQRPVKRDLYSFVAEKAFSFLLLGGALAAYKIKGFWDKREIGQIKSSLNELKKEIAALQLRSNQQEAALIDAVDLTKANTQALKVAAENFASAQEHIDAIREPVENVQANQQAILAKINSIVAKTEEYLHRREHKEKWSFF